MQALKRFFNRKNVVPYVFLTPFLVLFIAFKVWPFLSAVALSFQSLRGIGAGTWVGLDNYRMLVEDPLFVRSLSITTKYTVGTLLLLIPIPVVLAVILYNKSVKGAPVFHTIFFLPVLTSLVAAGTIFRIMMMEEGLINAFLRFFGLPPQRWLGTAELVVPSLIIIAVWRWTGMNIVYFMSGLTNIPAELYEAAKIDGANAFRRFFHITVPLLKPVIAFVTIISLIGGYQVFVEPYILFPSGMTPGAGGLTIAYYLYRTAFGYFNMGYASAIGVVLTLIILVLSLIQFRSFGIMREDK